MAKEQGEEILAEDVEAWVEQTSQDPFFLVGPLSTPLGFSGVFFECPSFLVSCWEMMVD